MVLRSIGRSSPRCWGGGWAATTGPSATGSGPPWRSRRVAFVGWFHLRPGEGAGPEEPELGYRLRREVWGRGYASEASTALIDKAFTEFGVDRVYASMMAVNSASRRVMEKSGMHLVRTFHADWPVRIPGDEEGDVEYAIDRVQWEGDRTV